MKPGDTIRLAEGATVFIAHKGKSFKLPTDIEVEIVDIPADNFGTAVCFDLNCFIDPEHFYAQKVQ